MKEGATVMRYLKKILLILTATIIGIAITNQVNAANNFHQPKNTVYQVTYINAGAYQTRHQFAIFNSQGHVIYIDVEDIDESGTPIVDDQATTTQRRAPQLLHRYLNNRQARNRAAKSTGFVVRLHQYVRIQNHLIPDAVTGKVNSESTGAFTITLPAEAKYQTIQFKPASARYQLKK